MTRRLLALLVAAAALAPQARADTIRASTTTLFNYRQIPYPRPLAGGGLALDPELETVAPIYEIVSVTASDVTTGFADEVEIALSTWGAVDLGSDLRRWDNGAPGTGRRVHGDVDVGYVKGELLGRRLILRVGRQIVAENGARMLHVDGGHVRLRLPGNLGLSAYAGSPVPPRFSGRGGLGMTGNRQANFAAGSRLSWFWPGRLEVGAAFAQANDRGDVAHQDVGADLRLFLPRRVELLTTGWWSLLEERPGEVDVSASWKPSRALQLLADWRHVEPDLFLPRTSIFSVFSDQRRNEVGGAVRLEPWRSTTFDLDYHRLFESNDADGHRLRGKGVFRPRSTTDVGAEVIVLAHPDDRGYWLARLFGAQRIRAFEVTADLIGTFFDRPVQTEDESLSATGTAAWRFARGWKALVAGTAGTTPYLERHFDVIAKLVYDQTYVTQEVR
jgi:hypothetical protein